MGGMYRNRGLNVANYLCLAALFVVAFAGTRAQALIDDDQFIASMIPHFAVAWPLVFQEVQSVIRSAKPAWHTVLKGH